MRNALFISLLAVTLAVPIQVQETVDLIFHNGTIFTADELLSTYSSIAVRDGRIVALGWDGLLDQYRADRTIDLRRRLVTPGFIDTHIHVSGDPERWVDLSGLEDMTELKARVTRKAEQLGSGEWITGYGWSEDELAELRKPVRWDLDDAAPVNPVVLTRAGGHSSVASTLALEAAGVTPDTETPPGGIIELDENGEMNGVLREGAQGLVRRLVPDPTPEELRASFVQNLRDLLSLGITSLIQAGVGIRGYEDWQSVYDEFRSALPRAAVQLRVPANVDRATAMLEEFGRVTGDGDEWLRVGPMKFFVDGGYTGAAAWTLAPYNGQPDYYGTGRAHRRGWPLSDLQSGPRSRLADGLPHNRRCGDQVDGRYVGADHRGIAPRRSSPLLEPLHRPAAGRDDAEDGDLQHPHRPAAQLHLYARRPIRGEPRGRADGDQQPAAVADVTRRLRGARERHPADRTDGRALCGSHPQGDDRRRPWPR